MHVPNGNTPSEISPHNIEMVNVETGYVNRYQLMPAVLDSLLAELLENHSVVNSPFVCFQLQGTSRYSDIARHIECEVFNEFFGNASDIMAEQYGAYEDASEFLLAVDIETFRAVGAVRIISYSSAGFKTLNDIAQPPLCLSSSAVQSACGIDDWSHCWDIATIAVIAAERGSASGQWVSTALYGQLYAQALNRKIAHFIAILDRHGRNQLTRSLGVPFKPILNTPTFRYLGSEHSQAMHVRLAEIRPHMDSYLAGVDQATRVVLEPLFDRLLNGTGLPPLLRIQE